MNWSIFLQIFTTIGMAVSTNGQCPVGCFCLPAIVTCPELTAFPTSFPVDTKRITFSDIDVEEIPAGSLNHLPALENIEFHSGTIERINTGAFGDLKYFEMIGFNNLQIGTISTGAFRNITDVGEIAIDMSTIDTIETGAFSDMFALDGITISSCNITQIDTGAFSNIDDLFVFSFHSNRIGTMSDHAFIEIVNGYELDMYSNIFKKLGCGTVDTLLNQTYEHNFQRNVVSCGCDMLWLKNNPSLHDHHDLNWCRSQETNEVIPWSDFSTSYLDCDIEDLQKCLQIPSLDQYFEVSVETSDLDIDTGSFESSGNKVDDTFNLENSDDDDDGDKETTTMFISYTDDKVHLAEWDSSTERSIDLQDGDHYDTESDLSDHLVPASPVENNPSLVVKTSLPSSSSSSSTPSSSTTTAAAATTTSPLSSSTTTSSVVSSSTAQTHLSTTEETENNFLNSQTFHVLDSGEDTKLQASKPTPISKSVDTQFVESTRYTPTKDPSKSTTPLLTSKFSRGTNDVTENNDSVNERHIPNKQSSGIELEEKSPKHSVIDVSLSGDVSNSEGDTNSEKSNVQSVAYVSDNSNSSKHYTLNFNLLFIAFVTAYFR